MTWVARTLWDLLRPQSPPTRPQPTKPKTDRSANGTHSAPLVPPPSTAATRRPARTRMQDRYDALVIEMKATYGVRVRKWRSTSSGVAWEITYEGGRVARLIEAPYPRGPMSCAIFLHEIGHHAIGFRVHRPRCLEEYHAWKWALDTMRDRDFNVTASVEKRMCDSLRYAVQKARRRGLKRVPTELLPYLL